MPTVLVVDDDEDMRAWLAEVLTGHGYRVETSEHSDDLVRTLSLGNVDLVLIDYHMPSRNGLSAIREVRAAKLSSPIVVMTADANQQVAVACFRAGAADFVAKPIDADYLSIVVERVLSAHAVNLKNTAYRALGYTHHKSDCLYERDGETCTCGLAEVFKAVQEF